MNWNDESSQKLREEEVIVDNLFLSQGTSWKEKEASRKKKVGEHAERVQEGAIFPIPSLVRVSALGKKT